MIAKKFIIVPVLILISFGCGGEKPNEPGGPPAPTVSFFDISPTDIVPPDSALVTWKTGQADSVKIFPTGQKLTPVDSGQIYIKPTVPTNYNLTAYSSGGTNSSSVISVTMSALAASISDFRITPDTVVTGDTSVITWTTNQADSIVLNNGYGRLNPTNTGQRFTILQNTALYRAIAYSIYGNDTATVNVRVKKPTMVRAINGDYYKGVMGSTQLSPGMRFLVVDNASMLLDDMWLNLRLLEGDGVLTPPDSVVTNSQGNADVTYNFNGALGHAVVSANFRDVDTVDIQLRANTIIPGVGGQGQYILFSDSLINVLNINGPPNSVDPDPNFWITYADYESTLDVVFVINDVNRDSLAQNTEDVLVVILTSGYTGKTKDSLGIGSTYGDIKALYGNPDDVFYSPADQSNPAAIGVDYGSIGTLFYIDTVIGNPADTNTPVIEIHLDDFVTPPVPAKLAPKSAIQSNDKPVKYRRYRR